jgi:hypothetical protein
VENQRLNRIKAIDITIDSLKQYITLSTVSIAGLIAFYNGLGKEHSTPLFIKAVICFVACTVCSVITINLFINKVHVNVTNVRNWAVRIPNFLAIAAFFGGITFAALFFFKKPNSKSIQINNQSTVVIDFDSVKGTLEKEMRTKVKIDVDTLTHHKTLTIDKN